MVELVCLVVSCCLTFFNLVRRLAEANAFLKYEVDGMESVTQTVNEL